MKLTDKQRKTILADYINGGISQRALAKKYSVSVTTIHKVVHEDGQLAQKLTQKKEENTADILAYMDSKKGDVCAIIDIYLEALKDSDRLSRANLQSIATSLGIIIDKFTYNATRPADTNMFESIIKANGGRFETN